jgi:AraC family transcriptional regulator, regulatory protein of adaptative response / methylated-DNA-[protein]-cysteine methyltransferase
MTAEPTQISSAVWQAVLSRDRQQDGKFVYAALTTGIYCRPSCPARHPQRRNTLIFTAAKDAEREGFIACHRCWPASNALTPAETGIKDALDYIESHIDQRITLITLSQVTGFSPNHLQQTFKHIVGLSPKAFCDARRLVHLKQYLKRGDSVISATYGAGYGSSRALYEKANEGLGMTPATYSRGGEGVQIRYVVLAANLGHTLVAATELGICAIIVGEDEKRIEAQLHQEFPNAKVLQERTPPVKWLKAIQSCQREDRMLSELPPDLRRRVFQARLGKALRPNSVCRDESPGPPTVSRAS